MMSLTPRQNSALRFLLSYQAEYGCAPSHGEIADALGLVSKSGVSRLLCGLEARGAIRRMANRARAIEIVDHGNRSLLEQLRPSVQAALAAHCAAHGERPDDVINDAVSLFLDGATALDVEARPDA